MSLSILARFRLPNGTLLNVCRGSVLDFASQFSDSAIVNAANEQCLGGLGVDGAISQAGGNMLQEARLALPILHRTTRARCLTGDAKLTGPGKFGDIKTNHVIHAVGPDYGMYTLEEYDEADLLLQSAYYRALLVAQGANVQELAFSLLSAGVYRGRRSLKQVLRLAIESFHSWAFKNHEITCIESIVMCAFLEAEAETLLQVATELGLELVPEATGLAAGNDNHPDSKPESNR